MQTLVLLSTHFKQQIQTFISSNKSSKVHLSCIEGGTRPYCAFPTYIEVLAYIKLIQTYKNNFEGSSRTILMGQPQSIILAPAVAR